MLIQILLGGVISTSIQPNMQRLMEVRDGKLDFALTKPEDSGAREHPRRQDLARGRRVRAAVLAYGIRARVERRDR